MRIKDKDKKHYTADFETLVLDEESITAGKPTYVWAAALCDIDNIDDVKYTTSIDSFFKEVEKLRSGSTIYFHNLKYDGQFIISYLLKNYKQVQSSRKMQPGTYTTLVSEIGIWYSITIKFNNKRQITIQDSYKKLPFSVAALAKQLGLPEEKGHIDYKKFRPENGTLSEEDKDYIRRDVQIVARAMKNICFDNELYKMTIGSDCMNYYKSITPKFKELFPVLSPEIDEFCRNAYKGGYCYVNPKIQGKRIRKVIGSTYDYNSMYPSVMHSQSKYTYPIGEPVYYTGMYDFKDYYHPLFIQHIRCSFELKKKHVPTIQIKNDFSFKENEYLERAVEPVELYLTQPDFELFIEHYDVYNFEAIDGYAFAEMSGLFDGYIDHWYKVKEEATKKGDKVQRMVSKLFLNNLYGKFSTGTNASKQEFYLDDNGIVRHKLIDEEKDGVYVPVGAFITAYARVELITAIQKNYNDFCYCDTDSIHLTKPEAKGIRVHDSALGHWKKESEWCEARFLRQKTYAEYIYDPKTKDYKWEYKACGMNDEVKQNIKDIDEFKVGATFPGKKITRRVPGGVVITETTFKILDI